MEPHLVALDVDGTILTHAGELRPATRDAIRAVADAGHHIVISTGRSVVATTPVLELLGLSHGWAVCSNGAVTLELDPAEPQGYRIADTVTFDPREALTLVMRHAPHILVAVEHPAACAPTTATKVQITKLRLFMVSPTCNRARGEATSQAELSCPLRRPPPPVGVVRRRAEGGPNAARREQPRWGHPRPGSTGGRRMFGAPA